MKDPNGSRRLAALEKSPSEATRRFGRRPLVRALLGLSALPLLEIVRSAEVTAQDGPRAPRLLIYHFPNGKVPEWWVPASPGAGLVFPAQAAALQPFASRILSIPGLSNNAALNSPGAAHAMGTGTLLTGTHIPSLTGGLFNNTSIDQAIAQSLETPARYRSLEWSAGEPGPCDVGNAPCAYTQSVSWAGPGSPRTPVIDPTTAFRQLFESGADGLVGPAGITRRASHQRMVEFLHAQAGDLSKDLGRSDRERLEEYVTALGDIERRLALEGPTCDSGASPGAGLDYPERVEAFHDLMLLALSCEQTNVLSFMMEFDLSGRSHPFIDAPGGHHALSHDQSPAGRQQLERLETWHTEKLASLLEKLDGVGASGSTLLDETLVLAIPSMGFGHTHDHGDVSPLLIGGKGFVEATGRARPGAGAPLANLYVTLLEGYGIAESFSLEGARFGDDGTSVLGGVLA